MHIILEQSDSCCITPGEVCTLLCKGKAADMKSITLLLFELQIKSSADETLQQS